LAYGGEADLPRESDLERATVVYRSAIPFDEDNFTFQPFDVEQRRNR
jgi:hypothetical protein